MWKSIEKSPAYFEGRLESIWIISSCIRELKQRENVKKVAIFHALQKTHSSSLQSVGAKNLKLLCTNFCLGCPDFNLFAAKSQSVSKSIFICRGLQYFRVGYKFKKVFFRKNKISIRNLKCRKLTHSSIEGQDGVLEPAGKVTSSVEFDGKPLTSWPPITTIKWSSIKINSKIKVMNQSEMQ